MTGRGEKRKASARMEPDQGRRWEPGTVAQRPRGPTPSVGRVYYLGSSSAKEGFTMRKSQLLCRGFARSTNTNYPTTQSGGKATRMASNSLCNSASSDVGFPVQPRADKRSHKDLHKSHTQADGKDAARIETH